MDDYTLAAPLTGRHGTTMVSRASEQDRTGRRPAQLDTIDETPRSGQESLEDGILALLPVLHHVAFRMTRGPQDAEDLVQDTVMRALTYRHQFRRDSNLRAWLITIMRSLVVSAYRRKRRAPQVQSLSDSEGEEALYGPGGIQGSPSAEHMMLHTWLDQELLAALASLPEHFRRAVELCDVDGLTYQETAQVLGCALGTVMSRLHRGRALLRKALTRSDGEQRTGVPARVQTRCSIDVAPESAAVPAVRAA